MSGVTIEPLLGPYNLGEGPHWDPKSKKLYFVDIFAQKIYRYDPVTKNLTSTYVDKGPVGFVVNLENDQDKLLATAGTDVILVSWDGEKDLEKCGTEKLASADAKPTEVRFNDGKVDPSGRLWCGTMGFEKGGVFPLNVGALYSLGTDLALKKHLPSISISNGLAWNSKANTVYYIDSLTYQVVAYDFDAQAGSISNKRVVFDLKENNISGIPDGMTIDTDGNLWVAVFGGSGVLNINPETGELLRYLKIDGAKNITSATFGGDDLDILYVTSATIGLTEDELKGQPHAGYVFAVKGLGVRGRPITPFKLRKN